ncbi:unnamed protein product [Closterium sp. Yama58-4]|nr:unnamed protein product [Closterium sp. Yama58-4]
MDWDMLTIKGTCRKVEKSYLRLTAAPDPSTVRPLDVLQEALAMVRAAHSQGGAEDEEAGAGGQGGKRGYLWRCDQLKSIRQDLTVQRIRNEFTVQVYEVHARMALEAADMPEFNQCQAQLKGLYAEGLRGHRGEFRAYALLHNVLSQGPRYDLQHAIARVTAEERQDSTMAHALRVREAFSRRDYSKFFSLYRHAPTLIQLLMDMQVEKQRFEAVQSMAKAYRPSLPVQYIAHVLAFGDSRDDKDTAQPATQGDGSVEGRGEDGGAAVHECCEWLKAHGCVLLAEDTADPLLDCKASVGLLFMPEAEDVVPHGDANLQVDDFFARRPDPDDDHDA